MKFVIHTDGGARGNPGPAAVGIVIQVNDKTIVAFGKRIGETTNNVAEYMAVIEALHFVKNYLPRSGISLRETIIQCYLDSTLVVQQLNGKFKVKNPMLRELLTRVRVLEQEVGLPAGKAGGGVSYHYIPREQNRRADFLVNSALDRTPHVSSL